MGDCRLKTTMRKLPAFEETLVSFVEEGAILAFIITSGGIVEYNFYTSDHEWFIERLNEAFADRAATAHRNLR